MTRTCSQRFVRFSIVAGAVALVVALAAGIQPAAAQSYPTRQVQMIVPYPAGGPADVLARGLAEKLAGSMKQPVIVVNQPGAGGNLGGKAVAQALPDGHTLLFTVDASLTANPALYGARMGFDPLKDLRPVSTLVTFGSTLAVHPSLNVSTLAQFLDAARKQPLTYASAGNASTGHLTMELLAGLAKVKLTHVPYKGAGPALTDMVGGQVQAGFLVTPGVAPHVRSGRLVPLAVSGEKRSEILPQVPTVTEAGLPGATLEFGMVLLVPGKTPDAVVRTLQEEIGKAMASPEMKKLGTDNDYDVVVDSPQQAAARLATMTKRLGDLIKALGVTAD